MDLSKKKMLFAVGCSHVAGSELEGDNIGQSEYNLRWCFSGQLAEKYNLEYVNIAKPSGCNHMINRSTIDWAIKFISEGGKPSDVFMLIGWTTNIRTEFYWKNRWVQWTVGADPNNFKHLGNLENLFKHFAVYLSNEKAGAINRIIYTISLNRFLESFGFDHLMFNSYNNDCGFNYAEVKHFEEFFPFHVYFEANNRFLNRYLPKYNHRLSKKMHADKYLHTKYAEALDEYIKGESE